MTGAERAARDRRQHKRMVANILALYLDAPGLIQGAGRVWYYEESARCADWAGRHGVTLDQAAGAAAVISPGMRWENVFSHLTALQRNPHHKVPTYSREFVERALRILSGKVPADSVVSGPKVTAFYRLLATAGRADDVVIDGHAWNIATDNAVVFRRRPGYAPPESSRVTDKRYRLAVEAYREAGEVLGERAHAVQATCWVHWRNLFNGG